MPQFVRVKTCFFAINLCTFEIGAYSTDRGRFRISARGGDIVCTMNQAKSTQGMAKFVEIPQRHPLSSFSLLIKAKLLLKFSKWKISFFSNGQKVK